MTLLIISPEWDLLGLHLVLKGKASAVEKYGLEFRVGVLDKRNQIPPAK